MACVLQSPSAPPLPTFTNLIYQPFMYTLSPTHTPTHPCTHPVAAHPPCHPPAPLLFTLQNSTKVPPTPASASLVSGPPAIPSFNPRALTLLQPSPHSACRACQTSLRSAARSCERFFSNSSVAPSVTGKPKGWAASEPRSCLFNHDLLFYR